jgi:hypothetical protein
MLKEPVKVPPLTTVPVNGTMSLAAGEFESLPLFDFESSSAITGETPTAATRTATLSRVDKIRILHLPLCVRQDMESVGLTTPPKGVQRGCLAETRTFRRRVRTFLPELGNAVISARSRFAYHGLP